MPGWEGDLCAEGKGCAWMRGILGEAVCEGEHCKCSTESEIVVRKAKWGNGVRLDARNPWGGSMRGRAEQVPGREGDCCTEGKEEAMSCVTKRRILS